MSERRNLLEFLLGGLLLGLASLFPDRYQAVLLATLAIFCFVICIRRTMRPMRHLFAAGIVFSTVAFYWLPDTMELFGGFPKPLAFTIFALFVLTSALQFALTGWLVRRFGKDGEGVHFLLFPVAWLFCEMFFPRLFPWNLSHNFLAWRSLAALAAYCGEFPLSFLLLLSASSAVEIFSNRQSRPGRQTAVLIAGLIAIVALPLTVGAIRFHEVSAALGAAPRSRVGIIQGNLHARKGADVTQLTPNLETYDRLSRLAQAAGADLLVWPESVMNRWTPTSVAQSVIKGTRFDPFPKGEGRLIYGTMTFAPKPQQELERLRRANLLTREDDAYDKFNSGLAIDNGRVIGMYHKRVLMPFGEYLPFSESFPWVRSLSPFSGNLTSGNILSPIIFPGTTSPELRAGILICYEDLVPRLARDYALLGANLLVNITNDAWYGYSHAQQQHNMLAAWRAIETSRTLVRSTNTGYSVAIAPNGETLASIPMYQEGFAVVEAPLLAETTFYSRVGESISWSVLLGGCFIVWLRRKRGLSEQKQ